jgi:hypothetical protein
MRVVKVAVKPLIGVPCDETDNTAMPTASESPTEIFTKLFAESRHALLRYIRRFVGSSETAKEIVQEAFLRTYRQRDSVTTLRVFHECSYNEVAERLGISAKTVEKHIARGPAWRIPSRAIFGNEYAVRREAPELISTSMHARADSSRGGTK